MWYRDLLLLRQWRSAICNMANKFFTSKQDSAPMYETINILVQNLVIFSRLTFFQPILVCSNLITQKISPHLKCIATLTSDLCLNTVHISEYCLFSDIDISQGSVATNMRYGRLFNDFSKIYRCV